MKSQNLLRTIGLLLFSFILYAQEPRKPDHYLIESFDPNILGEYDRQLLDTGLLWFHSANHDTSRVNALVFLSEEIYDPVWFDYNVYLKQYCEDLLENQDLDDYLVNFYKSALAGTVNNYGYYHSNRGRPDTAMKYYKESLRILQEVGNEHGSAQSLGNIGFQFNEMGEVDSALFYYREALKIERNYKDYNAMGTAFNNIASVLMDLADIRGALRYYDSALKIYEITGDQSGLALIMNNMAISYIEQGQDSLARVYLSHCMDIREQLGDNRGLAGVLNNIGTLYNEPGTKDEAMDYFQRSLELSTEMEDMTGMAQSMSHIGGVYFDKGEYEKALDFHLKAFAIRKEIKEKEGIAYSQASLARTYLALNDLEKALMLGKESLQHSEELGFIENIEMAARVLHDTYHEIGRWQKALEMHKLYIQMRDSLSNQFTQKESLKQQMTHEFEKKEAIKDAENAKQMEVVVEREEKQKMVSLGAGMGLILVVIFAIFVYNRLKESQRQKRIIEDQKKEVEDAHREVETKNKQIIDSIQYAKRIQQALLKSEEYETKHLPEHFILFLPKDIVSGDFYWAMEKEGHFYFAAADCTGHGVPGGFLTMLGTSFLNEINAREDLLTPAVLLDNLREKIIRELSQTGDEEATKDGMDISMIRLNLETLEVHWTGAHNPLYHFRDGQLDVVKPDKQPIGYHEYMTPFTDNKLQLKKGDSLYLFTDGFADQFGGPSGKKFMYKNFKQKIMEVASLPIAKQKEVLQETFNSWKGGLPQLDDVCVIGLKV